MRWLAADPAKALAAVEDPRIVANHLANDLFDWLEQTSGTEVVSVDVRTALAAMDREFDAMSEDASLWTPEAFTFHSRWRVQREAARGLLAMMGEDRQDDLLAGNV
jgi:hypothetical protein